MLIADGICMPCSYAESVGASTPNSRNRDVFQSYAREIASRVKARCKVGRSTYDCVVGVSGGKDSLRQMLFVRNVLGLNPLGACMSYPRSQTSLPGSKNLNHLASLGFALNVFVPPEPLWKELMRSSFLTFGNWAVPTEKALFVRPVAVAKAQGIETVLWGENPAMTTGEALHLSAADALDGSRVAKMNTLNLDFHSLIKAMRYPALIDRWMHLFDLDTLNFSEGSNCQFLYLGPALQDFGLINNGLRALSWGFTPWERDFDLFGVTSVDEPFVEVNQALRFAKFGLARAVDYLNEEIRFGRITKAEAIPILRRLDGYCSPRAAKQFCEYIEISPNEFFEVIEKFINNEIVSLNVHNKIEFEFRLSRRCN